MLFPCHTDEYLECLPLFNRNNKNKRKSFRSSYTIYLGPYWCSFSSPPHKKIILITFQKFFSSDNLLFGKSQVKEHAGSLDWEVCEELTLWTYTETSEMGKRSSLWFFVAVRIDTQSLVEIQVSSRENSVSFSPHRAYSMRALKRWRDLEGHLFISCRHRTDMWRQLLETFLLFKIHPGNRRPFGDWGNRTGHSHVLGCYFRFLTSRGTIRSSKHVGTLSQSSLDGFGNM